VGAAAVAAMLVCQGKRAGTAADSLGDAQMSDKNALRSRLPGRGNALNERLSPEAQELGLRLLGMVPGVPGATAGAYEGYRDNGMAGLLGSVASNFVNPMAGLIRKSSGGGPFVGMTAKVMRGDSPQYNALQDLSSVPPPSGFQLMPSKRVFRSPETSVSVVSPNPGEYVAEWSPAWGGAGKPFHVVGDSLDDVVTAATKRKSASELAADRAKKSAESKSLIGRLRSEFGDAFKESRSTQSKSSYIEHVPSGTKIRISDHNLPMTYDQPDLDFRIGTPTEDILSVIRKHLRGDPGEENALRILERNGAPPSGYQRLFDYTNLPERGRDVIRKNAEDLAEQLKQQGFDAQVTHSGSPAGPSSYLRVVDPETGRFFTKDVRFSGHSKGAFNNESVINVGSDSDWQSVIQLASKMRAMGPSEMMQMERHAENLMKQGMKRKQAIAEARKKFVP
jgi:hypothetical protein